VRRGATFGPEMPPSGLVPPLPFLPAATVCSTWHFSGLLHPETDPGVRQVSGLRGPPNPPGASVPRQAAVRPPCESRPRRVSTRHRRDRSPRAHPKRRSQASVASRWAGGVLQPFPLALHPSKLFPHLQPFRVNRLSLPHTFCHRALGEPRRRRRPVCGSAGLHGPPRSVPSRRWSQVMPFPLPRERSGGDRFVPDSSTSRP